MNREESFNKPKSKLAKDVYAYTSMCVSYLYCIAKDKDTVETKVNYIHHQIQSINKLSREMVEFLDSIDSLNFSSRYGSTRHVSTTFKFSIVEAFKSLVNEIIFGT